MNKKKILIIISAWSLLVTPQTYASVNIKTMFNNMPNVSNKFGTVVMPALSQDALLKYAEQITSSPATKFDKALDSEYLKNYIGGGNHRLFDGGHTLKGAYDKVTEICEQTNCTSSEKTKGYLGALWKDISTQKGLPFTTLEKETYDSMANWMTKTIPGVDKKWVYDALSYDVMEIILVGEIIDYLMADIR